MFLRRRLHILISSIVFTSLLFVPLSALIHPAAAGPDPLVVVGYNDVQSSVQAGPRAAFDMDSLDETWTLTSTPTGAPTPTPTTTPTPLVVRFLGMAGDGWVSYTGGSFSGCSQTTWNTGHNATSGTASYTTAGNTNWVGTGCTSGGAVNVSRGFLVFDTSALPDDAVITSASVNVYVTGKSDSKNDGNGFVSVVQGLQSSMASLTTTDYGRAGSAVTNPVEGSKRLDITGVEVMTFARWDLNATGVGWVSKSGVTKLALREGHDIVNAWPSYTSNTGDYISVYLSEQTGAAQDPFIEVTYTRP